jgi:predicted SpoU family rRNA methylase
MSRSPAAATNPGTGDNTMHRRLIGTVIVLLLAFPLHAEDRITAAQIQQVMDTTDAAAMKRDTAGIAAHLGDSFKKILEFPHDKWMARVKLNKQEYLTLIDAGWETVEDYDYQRTDTEIHVMPDGLSGLSYSTVTEHMIQDGKQMTSKFREYATYELEDGRPVITQVSGHTLVGDTTPE